MTEHRMEFTASENPWAPTAAVAEINDRTGSDLELIGLADQAGGTSSAAYVRWPDGRECALTRTDISLDWMRRTAEVLSMARAEGFPVPRHDLVIDLSDGRLAVVQERLPGQPANRVDASMIESMVLANEQFAGFLASRKNAPDLPFFLRPNEIDDQLWRQALETYSNRSRLLLRRIMEIEGIDRPEMTAHDLVHPDYGLGNVLFDETGNITGIVDWNGGATRGDRRFALLKLAINIAAEGEQYGVRPVARNRLDEIVNTMIDPVLLRLYWAQWTLRKVSHAIQNGFPSRDIERELRLGEDRLS
jgi:aminoglycoside phosphotransferase (APT) family kinase protein